MIDKGDFRSIRLQSHDYSEAGHYFVTINIDQRSNHFGHICEGRMILSKIGAIARDHWTKLSDRFSVIVIDEFVIMPDHMHGIIRIVDDESGDMNNRNAPDDTDAPVTAIHELRLPGQDALSQGHKDRPFDLEQYRRDRRQMLIPKAIGWYKMNVAREANQILKKTGTPFWQRNYYEHIIRTDRALENIRRYIRDNPKNWSEKRS